MISRNPRLRWALWSVVLVLGAAGLVAISAPAQAAGPQSRHGLGYRIGRTPYADGTWVGRYRVGRARGYRIQPRKSNVQSAYHPAHRVTRLPRSGRVATRRSAWILSTYGSTSDRTTAAAVDVAVNALLSRGRWRVGTAHTAHRTRPTGDGRFIRAYARIMLGQSKRRHGPYHATVSAHRVPVGDQTTVTVRVKNRRGLGPVITSQQPGLTVHVTYSSTKTRTVHLNSRGVGRVYFRAAGGRTRIRATVRDVPDAAVLVRRPKNRAASQLAVAGHHRAVRLRGYGLGVSTQRVAITNTSTSALVGRALRGTYSVSGLFGSEAVHYAVYGPFATAATSCTGTPLFTAEGTISRNGIGSLPRWDPARTGYYAWRLAAGGNLTTRPAGACGSAYLTQKHTGTHQSRHGRTHVVRLGTEFGPDITVSGFDRVEVHTVYTRVYGPFVHKSKARCNDVRLFRTLATSIRHNKRWHESTVVVHKRDVGYYVFQTTLGTGTFMRGSHSGCGSAVRLRK